MNENLNLVEILKDCPKGMPLDCEIFDGTITFSRIVNDEQYPIEIKIDDDYIEYLNKYGCYVDRSFCKCVIFPKGKTTWEGFQRPFVDGDIVINKNNIGTWVGIYHKDDRLNETFSSYCCIRRDGIFCANSENNHGYYETRLATKEEKEKFFQVIKDHGYKWDPETKTLEKLIEPKFKIGDVIISKNGLQIYNITDVTSEYYSVKVQDCSCVGLLSVKDQDDWILLPSKFDPKTLQPFDKVLVSCNDEWFCDFFSHYDDDVIKFNCICSGGCPYDCCIPYNDDTKHLIGKSIEEAPEFYKYWEE